MKLVKADLLRAEQPYLLEVTAYAPTLGWRDVSLAPVMYVKPPADGIQDVILYGTPPPSYGVTAIETFHLSVEIPEADWLQGVRISDSTGSSLIVLRSISENKKPIGKDSIRIMSAALREDRLLIDVLYSGGCETHQFQLDWDGSIIKTIPPQIYLDLSHNANHDKCKAILQERLQFDLSTINVHLVDHVIRVRSAHQVVIANDPTAVEEALML